MKVKVKLNYEKTNKLKNMLFSIAQSKFDDAFFERSDLISCPLQAYNRFKHVNITHIPMKKVAKWVIGEALHSIIQSAFKDVEIIETLSNDLRMRIDVMWDKIAEIKTTRLSVIKKEYIPNSYLRQIEFALAFRNQTEGYLITLDIVNALLLVWDVAFDQTYLIKRKKFYMESLNEIRKAIIMDNPKLLKPNLRMCGNCLYTRDCLYWFKGDDQA